MRNSGPLPGKYAAGDLVCYRIERDSNGIQTVLQAGLEYLESSVLME